MKSFKELTKTTKEKIRARMQQIKTKLGSKAKAQTKEPVYISQPTSFHHSKVTIETDVHGNAVLLEEAREDAQAMFTTAAEQAKEDEEVRKKQQLGATNRFGADHVSNRLEVSRWSEDTEDSAAPLLGPYLGDLS